MKKLLLLLFLISFAFYSCDNILGNEDDEKPNNPTAQFTDEEEVIETATTEFTGEDASLRFDNGAKFEIPGTANTSNQKAEIKIFEVGNERYFNTENNLIYDFSANESNYYVEFEYVLPKNLIKEDIHLILYNPTKSADKLEATQMAFDYTPETGSLQIQFYMFTGNELSGKIEKIQEDAKYNRLVLSWSDRFKLGTYPETKIIKMPYYEQPEGTCWATCATMLARAYSPNKDNKSQIRIIDFVRQKGDEDLNQAIGMIDFKSFLSGRINNYTNLKSEVSTFVSSSNMLEEIIKKLDENKPLILNFDSYSNPEGAHAVLIVGYRRDLVSASKISIQLMIHNPTGNVVDKVMYKWIDWDWFLLSKSYTEAFQILYPDISVMSERPLQTLGMPINELLGTLEFKISSPETGKSISIGMIYDRDAKHTYKWGKLNSSKEFDKFPDSTESMILKLPIYNADEKAAFLGLNLRIYNNDTGENVYDESDYLSFEAGLTKTDIEIPTSDFANFLKEETEFRAEFEIRNSNGVFLDGYTIHFILEPKITKILTFNINPLDVTTQVNSSTSSSTSTAEGTFGVHKITVNGKGKIYTGSKNTTLSQGIRTDNLTIEFDKELNPTKILKIELESIFEIDYYGQKGTNTTNVILENISSGQGQAIGSYINLEIDGTQVCDYISDITQTGTYQDGSTTKLIDYKCKANTSFTLTIE